MRIDMRTTILWVSLLACAVGTAAATTPQTTRAPWEAVRYVEFPEAGRLAASGRKLSTRGGMQYGIDINSRVDIRIDAEALRTQLTRDVPEATALTGRLQQLTTAAQHLGAAVQATTRAVEAFAEAERTGNYRAFKQQADAMASVLLPMLEALQQAAQARLEERLILEGRDQGSAKVLAATQSKQLFNAVFIPTGYDWGLLEQLFKTEIEAAQSRLQAVYTSLGTDIEIQAHLIKASGQALPIFLPGYNEVETGVVRRVEKVTFEVPQEANALYQAYLDMARQVGSTKDLGVAVLSQARTEFEAVRTELQQIFAGLRTTLTTAGQRLEALSIWASEDTRRQWFASVAATMQRTALAPRWQRIEPLFQDVKEDLEALKAYALLAVTLPTQSPEQAMSLILAVLQSLPVGDADGLRALNPVVWQRRVEELQQFVAEIDGLPRELRQALTQGANPVQDIRNAMPAVQAVFDAVKTTSAQTRRWLASLRASAPSRTAANLPVPPGQKRLEVRGDVSTAFNLQTIKPERQKDDQIRVQYRFFRGDQELVGAGWSDHFVLRIFGWQDTVVASFAFTQQKDQSEFEPTAVFSWLLKYRPYPSASQTGLAGRGGLEWFSGFGISTMPLNFSDGQDFELGIAATLSVINNRILFGYGANLQADDERGFWFFALRLFSTSGFIPTRK